MVLYSLSCIVQLKHSFTTLQLKISFCVSKKYFTYSLSLFDNTSLSLLEAEQGSLTDRWLSQAPPVAGNSSHHLLFPQISGQRWLSSTPCPGCLSPRTQPYHGIWRQDRHLMLQSSLISLLGTNITEKHGHGLELGQGTFNIIDGVVYVLNPSQ